MRYKDPDLQSEFQFKTSRSGGAGGQHVNKVATKVQLIFDVRQSAIISEDEKEILLAKLGNHISEEGVVQVISQAGRSQYANKLDALKKMYKLLNKCFEIPKKRKPSTPTRLSVYERKVEKKIKSEVKRLRSKPGLEDSH
jgi:ribosome-associated protein